MLVLLGCRGDPGKVFHALWVSTIGAALLVLTACGDDGSDSATGSSAENPLTTEGPVIALAEEWNGYPYAGYDNASLSVREGCLLVDGDVAFWPYGTSWDPSTSEVVISDDIRLGLDDKPDLGGGGYSLDTDWSWLGSAVANRIVRCLEETGADAARVVFYSHD